jgi:hypothetical protein
MSTDKDQKVAEIQLVNSGAQQMLKVVVPRGTTLADTVRLQPTISDLLGRLRGCLPCNSGVPIFFQEREELEHLVRVDLQSLKVI